MLNADVRDKRRGVLHLWQKCFHEERSALLVIDMHRRLVPADKRVQ
jgi:hypothetical protein